MSPDQNAAYNAYMAIQMFFKAINIIGVACACLFGDPMPQPGLQPELSGPSTPE